MNNNYSIQSFFSQLANDNQEKKLIIFMVGLPARWLSWMGYSTRVFNVGNYRRQRVGTNQDFHFFDHSDKQNNMIRHELAIDVLEECIYWLKNEGGTIGIHDATNTTKERREMLLKRCIIESNIDIVFIESICTDEKVLEQNINMKTQSPDYIHMDPKSARNDFLARLANYASVYEPIEENVPYSYIKVIDVGARVIANHIHGYLSSSAVLYLLNMHIQPRKIFLTRHGESTDNIDDRIGGDSPLTHKGILYSNILNQFFRKQKLDDLVIWTSTLSRTIETAKELAKNYKCIKIRALNEIYAGICEGLTYSEIQEKMPEVAKLRSENKLLFRYPGGGESYIDVVERLKPTIIELERIKHSVLIISHRAIIRTIYSYFMDISLNELPLIDIPLHTIICLTPTPYGCEEQRFDLNYLITENNTI